MTIYDSLIAKAIGESGGGGGGGSSDFSTAEITIIYSREYQPLTASFVWDNCINTYPGDNFHSGDVATLVLYKGVARIWSSEPVTETSGSIELDPDTGEYIVTGDCSISAIQ